MRAIFVAISIFSRCFETISDIESPPNREESDLTGLKQEDGYNNTRAEHHLQRNRGRPNYLTYRKCLASRVVSSRVGLKEKGI